MERLDVISAGDLRVGFMRCIRTASKGEGQMNAKDPGVRKALAAVLSPRRHHTCGVCAVTDALVNADPEVQRLPAEKCSAG